MWTCKGTAEKKQAMRPKGRTQPVVAGRWHNAECIEDMHPHCCRYFKRPTSLSSQQWAGYANPLSKFTIAAAVAVLQNPPQGRTHTWYRVKTLRRLSDFCPSHHLVYFASGWCGKTSRGDSARDMDDFEQKVCCAGGTPLQVSYLFNHHAL